MASLFSFTKTASHSPLASPACADAMWLPEFIYTRRDRPPRPSRLTTHRNPSSHERQHPKPNAQSGPHPPSLRPESCCTPIEKPNEMASMRSRNNKRHNDAHCTKLRWAEGMYEEVSHWQGSEQLFRGRDKSASKDLLLSCNLVYAASGGEERHV